MTPASPADGGPRVDLVTVAKDESGLRLDRWFKEHYPASASATCRS